MIQKPNSLTLMDNIDKITNDVNTIKNDLAALESQMETKLEILNTYFDTMNGTIAALEMIPEKARRKNMLVFGLDQDKIREAECSFYGQTVHPERIGLSNQVFNYLTDSGPLFKDNATVTISYIDDEGEEHIEDNSYECCNILKHDSDFTKKDVFHILPTNKVCLRIETQPGNLIGNTYFNMIEICPYLPGTFSIEAIRIWIIDQYLSNDKETQKESFTNENEPYYIKNVGFERFLLDKAYQLYKIEFDIEIHDTIGDKNGFPFGLRHIYFYNDNLDTENSYVIAEIKPDGYIDTVGESVTAVTPTGEEPLLGVEFYASFENNVLQGKLSQVGHIARNLESCYAKIPIRKPLRAVIFNDITIR